MAMAYSSVGADGLPFQLPESAYPHSAAGFLHGEMYFHGYPHMRPPFEHPLQPEIRQPRNVELPALAGVSTLSANEIRRDLQDIEETFVVEPESDDSVVVENIMPSSYPVKPRKTPKWPLMGQSHAYYGEDEDLEDNFGLEETMELFKVIEKARPEVFESERARERMEIRYQSMRDAYVVKYREYGKSKKGQQNLIRVLQAMTARKLAMVTSYHRQNAMMADVVQAFRKRAAATATLKESTSGIRRQLDNAKKRGVLPDDSVSVLDVHLYNDMQDKEPSQECLTLFVGMALQTPYGDGIIQTIHPRANKTVVQLSVGLLYAHIRNVVQWGPFDLVSDATLTARWDMLEQKVRMPVSSDLLIRSLLAETANEDDLLTDKDEDTAPEDEMPVAPAEVAGSEHIVPMDVDRTSQKQRRDWSKATISREDALLPVHAGGIPLVLAPVAAMPTIVQTLRSQKSEHVCASRPALLQLNGPATQAKEAAKMRAEFDTLTKQIKQLQAEHAVALQTIERNRQQTARTTQQITGIRTEMLTRRQRHRSVLSDHGVQEGQLPAAYSSNVKEDDSPTENNSSTPSNPIEVLAAVTDPDLPTKRKNDAATDSQESKNGTKTTKRRRA